MDAWFDVDDDEAETEAELLARLEDPEAIDDLTPAQRSQALVITTRQANASLSLALMAKGANVNEEDEFGCTPLMFAATHGLVDCLTVMLDTPRCIVNKRSHTMQTALHFAAKKGQVECVRMLLGRGAMLNVGDDWGETPLMLSVRAGSLESTESLLSHGARLGMINLRGLDALQYSAQGGHTRIMALLLSRDGCDINKVLKTSPLHQAAVFGHLECVRMLLSAGVRADIRDVHGLLPVEVATQTDKHEVVRYLAGRCNIGQECKNLALAAAAKSNGIACVSTLLELGADTEAVDMQGLPAFFWATAQNNSEIVKCFIRHNADVNRSLSRVYLVNSELRELTSELNLDFVSAVVVAAFRDYCQLVKVLVLAGARPDAVLRLWEENQLPQTFSSDVTLVSWLAHHATCPKTLAFLCRKKIRGTLPDTAYQHVHRLPLPKPIQDYLKFSDLDLV